MFAISLEGFRRTLDVRSWWQEYLRQCWFIAKVTSIPVVLISIPFGAVIALHVGVRSPASSAPSRPPVPRWCWPSCARPRPWPPRCSSPAPVARR